MPVIQLPRDTRGSELGTAIAGATKSLTDAYMQREVATGVAEIIDNPAIAPDKKAVEALRKFGDEGYEFYKKFQQTQLLETQMKNLLADAGLATVRQKLVGAQGDIAQAQIPTAQAQSQADLAKTLATTQQIGAQTKATEAGTAQQIQQTGQEAQLFPSKLETAQQQPDLAKSQTAVNLGRALQAKPEIAKTEAETRLIDFKLAQSKQIIDQQSQLFGSPQAGASYDNFARSVGVHPDSPGAVFAKNSAMMEPDPLKRGEVYSKALGEEVKRIAEVNKQKPLTSPQEERVVGAERQAASAERFITAFNRGGSQQTGWPKLAPVKQFFEQIGFSSGDPEFVEMFNSTLQQVGDAARSGAQFYSSGVLKLAKETTPNIAGSPLHAVLAMNEIAARNIATLEGQKRDMLSGQPTAGIDNAIKRWEAIKQKTDVDSYTIRPWQVQVTRPDGSTFTRTITNVDNPAPPPAGTAVFSRDGKPEGQVSALIGPAGDPNTVVFYGNNQIDPSTLKTVFDAKSSWKIGGETFTGTELISAARQSGKTPEAILRELQAQAPAGKAPIR